MKSIDGRNNIKIYNLCAGRSLPEWLSSKKRRKLLKRNADMRMKIELLQDFTMPDICSRIKVSEDGQYVIATGTYKPRIKCFDVSALSLKFERCLDADVVEFLLFTEDYRKMVFLEEERFLEFHNQGGRWYRTRIPKFGRDLAYHYPSCDLYVAAAGNEIYRMNLLEGRFGNSLFIGSESVNKCVFNPVHYLLTVGTNDGLVEAWDPRSRQRVGLLDCTLSMVKENVNLPYYKSVEELGITSLAYGDGLNLAVGTYTGQVLLYDIRSRKPYLVKNKLDDSPIISLEFLKDQNVIYSLSKDSLNIWDSNTSKSYTCIESGIRYNDMCAIPGSGMIFLAAESPKMESYFIPSLGPAPKWCGALDALVEELEEEEIPASYDDYKFVTENELTLLGLDSLIGTNCLKAVMHGYYIDMRLYNKARSAVNLLDKETIVKQKVKQKLAEQKDKLKTLKTKDSKSVPGVNEEAFLKLQDEISKGGEKSSIAREVLEDPRFAALFSKSEFNIDKESESFRLIQPLGSRPGERFKQMQDSDEEDGPDRNTNVKESQDEDGHSSDADSIISSIEGECLEDLEEEAITPMKQKQSKKRPKKKSKNIENVQNSEGSDDGAEESKVEERRFRAADTWNDLEDDWSKKKLTLGELLEEQEANEVEIKEHAHGSKEMTFTFEAAPKKFEELRKKQKEHHKHRKDVVRKANKEWKNLWDGVDQETRKHDQSDDKGILSSNGCEMSERLPALRISKLAFRQQEERASFSLETMGKKSLQTSHLSFCNQPENELIEPNNGDSDSEIDESIFLQAIPSPVSLAEECSEDLNENRKEVSAAKPFPFQENIVAANTTTNTTVIKPKPLSLKRSAKKDTMSEKERALVRQSEILKVEFGGTKSEMNVVHSTVRFYKSSVDGKIYGIFPVPVDVSDHHEKIIACRVFNFSQESIPIFQQQFSFTKMNSL